MAHPGLFRVATILVRRRRISTSAAAFCLLVPFAVGAQEKSCQPTVVGHLDILPLTSHVFHNQRSLRVWLPPGYDDAVNAQRKYKVLYLLDGQSMFDKCTGLNHNEMRADETLTELINAGKIEPIIAVGVDNGSPIDEKGLYVYGTAQRAREYLPFADPTNPSVSDAKDVMGNDFPGFLETEVMPPIAAKYRILAGPENTALGGASYGGVATVYALIRRPDLFGSGIVESPSTQVGNGQMLRDTVSLVVGPTRVAFGVGTAEDDDEPHGDVISPTYVREVTMLSDRFKAILENPPQVQLTIRQGAKHNYTAFGERFATALLFLYAPLSAK
jgi:enterochelin esterase-like enzyme